MRPTMRMVVGGLVLAALLGAGWWMQGTGAEARTPATASVPPVQVGGPPPVPVGAGAHEGASWLPAAAAATRVPAPDSCDLGAWTTQAAIPDPVYGAAMAAQGDMLYSFGGGSAGTDAYRYDPGTNAWTPIAPLPAEHLYGSAVSDGTYVYILNGGNGSGGAGARLDRYDPATDSYTTLAAPPVPTGLQGAALLDGKIYRVAGNSYPTQTTSVDVYTIATDTWAPIGTVADYPLAVGGLSAAAANGAIFAAGGADDVTMTNKAYRYDPGTNTWDDAALPDLPADRYAGAADVLDGQVVLAGGFGWAFQIDREVLTLDPANPGAGWQPRAWMPHFHWFAAGASAAGRFYMVGGYEQVGPGPGGVSVDAFTLSPCATASPTPTAAVASPTPPACGSSTWETAPAYPVPVAIAASATQNGKLYIFGGWIDAVSNADAYSYDGASGAWTRLAPLPVALAGAAAVSDGTYIYILGGQDNFPTVRADFYRYDPATDSYTQLAAAPLGTMLSGAAYLAGHVYRIGGAAQPNDAGQVASVDVYDIATDSWAPGGTAADFPSQVADPAVVGAGGYIYAAGGERDQAVLSAAYRYDPGTNTWDDAAVPDLPAGQTNAAAGLLGNAWILAGGGWTPGTAAVGLDLTNLAAGWSTLPDVPDGRYYPAGGVAGDRFYLVGGINGDLQVALDSFSYVEGVCSTPTATATATGTRVPAGDPCDLGVWATRADYPSTVYHAAVAGQDGMLYSFGGSSNNTAAYRYDPAANSWAPIAPLPAALLGASAVSDGTYIYVVNGGNGNPGATAGLYRYDPATDSYTTLATPPVATYEQAAVLLNGQIYRISGYGASGATASVDVYTIATDTWAPAGTVADYPMPGGGLNAVAAGGYIYAAGGAGYVDVTDKAYRYDRGTNTWDDAAVPDLPADRYSGAAGLLDGQIVLAGGFGWDYQIDREVLTLDPANPGAGWQPRAWMPRFHWLTSGATAGDQFYVVGGYATIGPGSAGHLEAAPQWGESQAVEAFTLNPCATVSPTPTAPAPSPTPPVCGAAAWQTAPAYPVPVSAAASATQGGKLYVFGGFVETLGIADAFRYDPDSASWTRLSPLPMALFGAAAVSDGTYLYILGGVDNYPTVHAGLYRYDPLSDSYTALASAPEATNMHAAVYRDGKIYRIGGTDSAGSQGAVASVDVYSVATNTWAPPGTVAPLPIGVQSEAAVATAGGIDVAGGIPDSGPAVTAAYHYDPATNTWDDAAVPDLPVGQGYVVDGVLGNVWILATGGDRVPGAGAEALDLTNPAGGWTTLAPAPDARGYAAGGAAAGAFYVVGGFNSDIVVQESAFAYVQGICPSPTATATAVPPGATATPGPPTATPGRPTATPDIRPDARFEATPCALPGQLQRRTPDRLLLPARAVPGLPRGGLGVCGRDVPAVHLHHAGADGQDRRAGLRPADRHAGRGRLHLRRRAPGLPVLCRHRDRRSRRHRERL